ncbi:hypothetical protein Hypma_015388 [Hypsizygus marmoreus]|uniref:Transmembrane protein n=1 Tax=Hypsizygus marmoreus TaxID=39966 RepID=A0A369K5Y5_HYPMA|nr:hypothetical protein Hypma_015388 [Hypsizygus marmoreus]
MPNAGSTPFSLTLSDDSALESVLSDIPFLCVGLMAFGVFTFVLFLKRVNLVAIYLYVSSFLAFAAAILDLGNILTTNWDSTSSDADSASALVVAREVGLALSLGFSYLFLWHLVAQSFLHQVPSHDDVPSETSSTKLAHGASWERWGVFGLLFKWSLLGLTFAITILQIFWRISMPNARFGTVYIAEATIEVIVSALFMLKLVLNVFLSPLTPWWRPMRTAVAPIVALLISAGLGLGNLVALAFSETTLGRFLRAVEMYILILFFLTISFYKFKLPSHPTPPPQVNRSSSFFVLPSKMQVSPYPIPPRNVRNSDIIPIRHPNLVANLEPKRRSFASTLSQLSARIIPRKADLRESAERIWDDDKELGLGSSHSPVAQPEAPVPDAAVLNQFPIEIDSSKVENHVAGSDEQPSPARRPWTEVSISSYYGMERGVNTSLPPAILSRETDSPVYGLNGIISRSRVPEAASRPLSNLSFDELLRQQTELDKSIAALRLIPSGASSPIPESQPEVADPLPSKASGNPITRSTSLSTNSYLGRKPESVSNRSDFSLSIFPEPPVADVEPMATSRRLEMFAGRPRTQHQRTSPVDMALDSIPGIVAEDEKASLPVSPSRSENNVKFDSAGTQYDVTSFIGGLTGPTSGTMLLTGSMTLSDVESEDESTPKIVPVNLSITQSVRPMILASSVTLSLPTSSDKASSVDPNRETRPLRREPSVTLRPLLLGTSNQAVPVILPSSTMVPIGTRRIISKGGILSGNPRRPIIGPPSLPPEDGRGDQAPGAFEHPRPPPLRMP